MSSPHPRPGSTRPTVRTLTFASADQTCEGTFFAAAGNARPVVLLGHGVGGTRDSGLAPFAEAFAAAGLHALTFDYRGFGGSTGHPRQVVDLAGQVADYRAAMRAVAALPEVDASRLVLWGVSLSGGTVLRAAADRIDVAAVISLVPLVHGPAASIHAARHAPRGTLLRTSLSCTAQLLRGRGRTGSVPLVAESGRAAVLGAEGFHEQYRRVAGPTWVNAVAPNLAGQILRARPDRLAPRLRGAWLVQIADFDRGCPPHAAATAAVRGRAEVRHYPCDHFDVLPGGSCFDRVVQHQVAFLRRHLGD